MTFITSIYGNDYVLLLTVCLDSLLKAHPNDSVIVMWDDVSETEIKLLKHRFSAVEFLEKEKNICYSDPRKRIPLKLRFWADVCRSSRKDDFLCFLDCDTVILKNINQYLDGDFDFLYTWKEEKFPINVGVVIVRNSEKINKFIELWLKYTEDILNSSELLRFACDKFGSADQKSLIDLMNLKSYKDGGEHTFDFGTIRFKGVTCAELNQTNSVPINYGSSILHYKGGWRPILLGESGYGRFRDQKTSMEMHKFWENSYSEIIDGTIKDFVIEAAEKHIRLVDWQEIDFEERGILHSEMLAVIAMIKELNIDMVIESGRARGQSTMILANAFKGEGLPIFSIDREENKDTKFASLALSRYSFVKLIFGDSNILIPRLIRRFPEKKIAVLFDGPKGKEAFRLFSKILPLNKNVIVGFFHDCRKSFKRMINSSRSEIHSYFERIFFTDDDNYIAKFNHIDENCKTQEKDISVNSWRPYRKGWEKIGSYGPTLAVVIPTSRDRKRKVNGNNSLLKIIRRKISILSELFK